MTTTVKQAAHVLELVAFFAQRQRPASGGDIARHFGWPRSSTFNLLGTLAERGFLYEPEARGEFYPAPQWSMLVHAIESADPVPLRLHDMLREIADETGETAVLAAISGPHALYVDFVESPHPVRYTVTPGKMVPLHATATGRALMSQMAPAERAAFLARVTFQRYTPTSLTSAAAVEREIAKSLVRGWFEGNAEYTADLGGVALPLASPHRRLAVLAAGPMFRVESKFEKLAKALRKGIARHAKVVGGKA